MSAGHPQYQPPAEWSQPLVNQPHQSPDWASPIFLNERGYPINQSFKTGEKPR